jgi:glycosyl transferase, family 25
MKISRTFGETINNFFDHVFVISLSRSKDRHAEMVKELSKYNISFSFIEGVDGMEIDLNNLPSTVYDNNLALQNTGFPITQGELGCSLSVLKICRKVVEEKLESVLILQDDVKVNELNQKYAESLLTSVKFKWDLLYLGHSEDCMYLPIKVRAKVIVDYIRHWLTDKIYNQPAEIRNSYRRAFTKYWYKAGAHNGGYAYGVSFEGAKKLITGFSPIFAVDDTTYNYLIKKGCIRAFSPKFFLFDQRWDLGSEIGERPSWKLNK